MVWCQIIPMLLRETQMAQFIEACMHNQALTGEVNHCIHVWIRQYCWYYIGINYSANGTQKLQQIHIRRTCVNVYLSFSGFRCIYIFR